MWGGELESYVVSHIAYETETRNKRQLSIFVVKRDHFIFLPEGLVLALFVVFGFFELFAKVALAIAVHHGLVLIDAKFGCDLGLIDLIVGAQS